VNGGTLRARAAGRERSGGGSMADLAFLSIIVGFFALTWGFVRLADRI
jgi:hypothetical protein